MKINRLLTALLFGLFIISSLSCYNTLGDIFKEANYNPASLESLDVSAGGSLSPSFDMDKTTYNLSVLNEYDSIKVTPEAISSDGKIEYNIDGGTAVSCISGTAITVGSLAVGIPRVLSITVTASGGKVTMEYKISITRQGSTDATLSILSVTKGSLSPSFASGTLNYSLTLAYGDTSVNITPELNTSTASMTYRIDSGTWNTASSGTAIPLSGLVVNPPQILNIKVTAQNGTTIRNYIVTVSSGPNTDASLSALAVTGGALNETFLSSTLSYTVNVAYSVTSIALTGTKNDANATLSANNGVVQNLNYGANTITIRVTAQDGVTYRDYAVIVNRSRAVWARSVVDGAGGGFFSSVAVDSSGNIITAGIQNSANTFTYYSGVPAVTATAPFTGSNIALVKYNSSGYALWARTVTSAPGLSSFSSVAVVTGNNIYAAGEQYYNGTYNYGTSVIPQNAAGAYSSGGNALLVKYDSTGTALWARSVPTGPGRSSYSSVAVYSVTGDVYAAGCQYGSDIFNYGGSAGGFGSNSNSNAVLVKYNQDGTAQWARTVTLGPSSSAFLSIAVDSSGNLYVAGYQSGNNTHNYGTVFLPVNATGSSPFNNVVLVKYNSSGDAQWARTVNTGTSDCMFRAIALDSDGNIYAAGYQWGTGTNKYGSSSVAGTFSDYNALLVKYDTNGTALWARTVSSGSSSSNFNSVAADSAGNVYASGYQEGTGTYTYGTGVSAAGTAATAGSNDNAVLVKYDTNGTALWANTVSAGSNDSTFNSIAADSTGNVYVSGYQTATGTYTYGTGVSLTAPTGSQNILLVKYKQ